MRKSETSSALATWSVTAIATASAPDVADPGPLSARVSR
jgi:hypothetical protein